MTVVGVEDLQEACQKLAGVRGGLHHCGVATLHAGHQRPTVGALRLPLGGVNGYMHVRGKQGRAKNMYQGTTPRKSRRTALFGTAREAAIALAELKEQRLELVGDPSKQLDFSEAALAAPRTSHGSRESPFSSLHGMPSVRIALLRGLRCRHIDSFDLVMPLRE